MTIRREPPSDPPSVLLRAIGDLLRDMGASRTHPDDIAAELGHDPAGADM